MRLKPSNSAPASLKMVHPYTLSNGQMFKNSKTRLALAI
ncbi:hypothetical protein CEV33_4344 [Brucella grignonensis]|uniref:Uncharacterized protein n=1 Tax=Brucella grignonensis TaxID=94627 RepID=A0A256FNA3_9HYPH|nr:hypothetical protein CEV33_4344 [Brucella grignonensis]